MANDNVALHRGGHAAFSRGDVDHLRRVWADDILWHVAGRSPVAGDYRGQDAVLAFMADLAERTGGTLEIEDQFFMGEGDRTVALFKIRGTRGDKKLDADYCEVCRWEQGRVVEDWGFAFDQYTHDEFWS